MNTLSHERIISISEVTYNPNYELSGITEETRTSCVELLRQHGYICVAGCAGAPNATVGELDKEARADAIALADASDTNKFITGPHPSITTGVGIWASAAQ